MSINEISLSVIVASIIMFVPFKGNSQPAKVRAYYQYVNEAEMSIISNDLDHAGKCYANAFINKYPNGKDLYNAFLVAYYETDSVLARVYFNELAYKGLHRSVFKDTAENYGFYKYISTDYSSYRSAGANSQMPVYGAILKSILSADQAVRKNNPEAMGISRDSNYIEQIVKVDSTNIERIRRFIDTYGYPNFEKVGFWDGTAPNNPGTIWKVLWHSRPNATPIDSLIHKAVLDGHFRPDDWATILTSRSNADSFNLHLKVWSKDKDLKPTEIIQSNRARASLYLESLADYYTKWTTAQKLLEISTTDFNPKVYKYNPAIKYQFVFLNAFLILSNEHIKSGRLN